MCGCCCRGACRGASQCSDDEDDDEEDDEEAGPAAGSLRTVAAVGSGWLDEASATSLSKPLLTRACQWWRPCDEPSGLRASASALMVNFSSTSTPVSDFMRMQTVLSPSPSGGTLLASAAAAASALLRSL